MAEYNEIEFNGLLSKEEFFRLIEAVRRDGAIDETEAERLTDWAMKKLTDAQIVRLMIEGLLVVSRWVDGDPMVEPTMDAIVALNAKYEAELKAADAISI